MYSLRRRCLHSYKYAKIEYNEEITYLIHNIAKEEITIDISSLEISQLIDFIGQGEAKLDGSTLIIGPQTSILLK